MTETLTNEFAGFLSVLPARRLKQNTFRALLYFYRHRHEEGVPDHMDNLLSDLIMLIELLDNIDREIAPSHPS
jgi:hypothetical protein